MKSTKFVDEIKRKNDRMSAMNLEFERDRKRERDTVKEKEKSL